MAGSPEARVRSLHLNTERGFRGGEVQTLGLVKVLASRGHAVLLSAPPGSTLLERADSEGLETRPLRALGEWDLLEAHRIRRFAKKWGAEVLHAHTPHALALALLARGPSGKPAVVASRRVSFALRSGWSARKWGQADAVVAVSESIAADLVASGLDPARIRVVHSGVDLSRFASLPGRSEARARWGLPVGCPVVGVVSALSHHKGVGDFVRALQRVWLEVPEVRAVVAGTGDLLAPLKKAAEIQNLPVSFLGFLPEPAELLPALDVLALPSLSGEGSPGAVKEAAAAGVPVVATDVGGTTEILRSGLEALIAPPGDPAALAQAILRILREPGLADGLREAARARIQSFSMESMATSILSIYRDLLAR